MKHKFIVSFLISVFLICSFPIRSYAVEVIPPDISSTYAVLLDTDRGQVLYTKNSDTIISSDLCATIMSAITVLEFTDIPTITTVSSILSETTFNTLDIEIGDKYPTEDLLNAMLLKSAPDIAMILANSIYTDMNEFIAKMNEKALNLGLKDTSFFVNEGSNSYFSSTTTLNDLSKLLLYSLRNAAFKKIFSTRLFLFTVDEINNVIIPNSNDLLWKFDNITGGMKSYFRFTSNTATITTSSLNNLNLLTILADDSKKQSDQDTNALMKYAQENYRRGILVAKNQTISNIDVNGIEVALSPNMDIYYTYPIGQSFVSRVTYSLPEKVDLPISRNVTIGTATYELQDGTIIKITLYPDQEIMPHAGLYKKVIEKLKQQKDLLNVVLALVILEFLVIIYRLIKKLKNI